MVTHSHKALEPTSQSGSFATDRLDFIGLNAPIVMNPNTDISPLFEGLPDCWLSQANRFSSLALALLINKFSYGDIAHGI